MEEKRIYLILGIPLAGAALLAAVIFYRHGSASQPPSKPGTLKPAAVVYAPARAEAAPRPAPPEKIAQATETVRIRGTYQNYRRAVVTKDEGLQKAILPVLLKDREAARQCAQDDLARAQNDQDRSVARKVIEDLRR